MSLEALVTSEASSGPSNFNSNSRIICRVCEKQFSQYTCPRCNIRYCSLPCYKSHSLRCTESFMRENVMGGLQQMQPDEESKSKMLDILKRLHEEEETDGFNEDELNSSLSESELNSSLSEETIEKILSGGTISLNDLSLEERKRFERAVASGELSKLIEPWDPWWSRPSAQYISLSSNSGLPFIGNLLQIGSAADLPFYLWQLSKKYGPIMQMRIGCVPMLIISSPKLAQEVMKSQDLSFCNRSRFLGQRKLSYGCTDMVFSPYGEYWREMRKITAVHLFNTKKNQSFRPIREAEVSRTVQKIRSLSESSEPVDLSHVAMTLGGSLICRIAFGKRYDDGGPEMRRFEKLLHDAQASLMEFYVSDYFPSLGWVDRLSGAVDRVERIFNDLDSFYQELIDEHLDPAREKEGKEDDVLDILIKIKEEKLSSVDLDWNRVKALLTDIFIAATDTSAASIVWTMTALIKAPIVMHKVQAEIRNMVGKKGKVDEDDILNLPYLKAVINETFRLYPPAPLLVPRLTIEKCTLEGYQIQPETVVFVNAWAVARDPEYWENPNEFVPERFLNSTVDVKGQDFGLIPFGSGRRMCPGMLMGLSNVELTVANLLYSFDWELPSSGIRAEDIDTKPLPGITMHKKNPLVLVAKKIEQRCNKTPKRFPE